MILQVDLAWLLDIAQKVIPGDPGITDWGSLEAARCRHAFRVMDTPVYERPHHRAAALLHQLVRVPALEHSNELFALAVSVGYLRASGQAVEFTGQEAIDLVDGVVAGEVDVRQIAAVLKNWTR
ncbi:fic family toxin-antitoxin system, toxin component [Streptomyces sp. NPDC127049]|uniref:fic family toxin-antitoxin system, toxin component n=1 Tax=unclassified Streptomyces TaxID=2593676 RepID=UPI0036593555